MHLKSIRRSTSPRVTWGATHPTDALWEPTWQPGGAGSARLPPAAPRVQGHPGDARARRSPRLIHQSALGFHLKAGGTRINTERGKLISIHSVVINGELNKNQCGAVRSSRLPRVQPRWDAAASPFPRGAGRYSHGAGKLRESLVLRQSPERSRLAASIRPSNYLAEVILFLTPRDH